MMCSLRTLPKLSILMVLVFSISAAGMVEGDVRLNCERSEESVIAAARSHISEGENLLLRAVRRGDLDYPFYPQWHNRKRYVAFGVTTEGPHHGPGIVQIGEDSTVLVLLEPESCNVYPLRGASIAADSFSRLAKDASVALESQEDAVSLFWLYAKIGSGYIDELLQRSEEVKLRFERMSMDFTTDGESKFEKRWKHWAKDNAGMLSAIVSPAARIVENSYLVEYYRLDGWWVQKGSVLIGMDGTIRNVHVEQLGTRFPEFGR